MMKKLRVLICAIWLSCGVGEIATATVIFGTPTLDLSTAQVGVVNAAGNTIFYIPLDPNRGGTYGAKTGTNPPVGDTGYGLIGTTQDTVNVDEPNKPIAGGLLHMYMHFPVPVGEVGTDLTLAFTDLDLDPWNDPNGFFESLTLYGQGVGLPTNRFESFPVFNSELNVQVVNTDPSTNNDINIHISGLSIPSGDFWLHMGLQAYSNGLPDGWWTNTEEKVTAATLNTQSPATTSNIPEPSTLLLFASGILGMLGHAQRRKHNHQ